MAWFLGLMSGTSVDGIDGVLARFDQAPAGQPSAFSGVCAHVHETFDPLLREKIEALQSPGWDELHRAASAGLLLADAYANVVLSLLRKAGLPAQAISAIGAHGQTIRHRPDVGYSLQILNPSRLSERCKIRVVSDLRSADLAAGGQGAPLVPAFHCVAFQDTSRTRAIVNIGGIANISVLPPSAENRPVAGFDIGPGNILIDAWIRHHKGQPYDNDGRWARSGRIHPALLDHWLNHTPFFRKDPPKSTGRDLFNLDWINHSIQIFLCREAAYTSHRAELDPADVQTTLTELTAWTIAQAARNAASAEVFLCGGGVRNLYLVERITSLLSPVPTCSTKSLGLAPELVEATSFAWLAAQRTWGLPGNLPSVTGARGYKVLGSETTILASE